MTALTTRLHEAGLDPQAVDVIVRAALAEDGAEDVTSEPIFNADAWASGDLVARSPGVAAGIPIAEAVFAAEISPTWSSFTFFIVLIAILLLRPQGLFGTTERGAL